MIQQANQPAAPATTAEKARPVPYATPSANIREEKDHFVVELEMPGVRKDGLEITIEGNELTIIGHRSDAAPPGEFVYRESRPVDYRRVFDLDPSIDAGRITARTEQGVLTLTLPKAESVKPRKIAVTE